MHAKNKGKKMQVRNHFWTYDLQTFIDKYTVIIKQRLIQTLHSLLHQYNESTQNAPLLFSATS